MSMNNREESGFTPLTLEGDSVIVAFGQSVNDAKDLEEAIRKDYKDKTGKELTKRISSDILNIVISAGLESILK